MQRIVLSVSIGLLVAATALAGDLNPPAGPIGATMKPLSQVEPRIAINATNTPGDANSTFKISNPGSYYLCTSLVGVAGKHGIEIASNDVTVDLNGFTLAGVPGSFSGISADNTVRHRVSILNGNVVAWGFDGISLTIGTSSGILLDRVHASGNGGIGVYVARDSRISACVAEQNGAHGISVFYGSTIVECVSAGNGGIGIVTVGSCVISKCTARSNEAGGISAFEDNLVESCVVAGNLSDGISVGYDCVVRGNVCTGNGQGAGVGAGITAGQSNRGNRIEDNQVNNNDFGLKIDGDNNFIVRNTARGNTSGNFSVAAGNELATIITNPGSSNFGTATPWSNFSY